jgi:hypothetical protein
MMKILDASYALTGRDSGRNEIGIVTVFFSNGQSVPFDDVRRDSFEWWGESGYDPRRVPYEMTFAFKPWLARLQEHDIGEEAPDDELANEHEHIRDDDHLGQVTGFPTPGFEPEED